MLTVLKGNILHMPACGRYDILENGYLVLEDGVIRGLYEQLPEEMRPLPLADYGDRLIVQAFTDMHLHAPQYAMLGMGMDLPLLDWLNTYAFRTEARYADTEFARRSYRQFARDLIANGTTRAAVFASLHTDATLILMEELENAGVSGFVGKVNMDRNAAPYYQERTEDSKKETLRWLRECERFQKVKPILTPRFTPSCTDELMAFLGELARERNLPVQSHLSENLTEIDWVKRLHPDCELYWETYHKYGLFREGTVMAHCVHSGEMEQQAILDHNVLVAHCPDSNINICSGFAPVREMLERGVWVALGSDVAGGAELPMMRVITAAIRASKARRIESNGRIPALSVAEASYLATTAGARYFGFGDGFSVGDPLHALVLDDSRLPEPARVLTVAERYERLIYLADERSIVARYADGALLA